VTNAGSSSHSRAPKVVIDELVYQRIMHWVNKSQYEVSGLGKVVVEDGVVRVVAAYLLPQKNSQTSTDIEAADVGRLAYETRDEPGELRFWWHSHVNMQVFWSGTDLETINQLGAHGWFVHTVFNKRNETRTAISMGDPFPAMIDNITLHIEHQIDSNLIAQWDKEYESKVTNIVPKPVAASAKRFSQANQHTSKLPKFNLEERAEIARLSQMMMEHENPNFPGLGADGVYNDADSLLDGPHSYLTDDESPSWGREHSKAAHFDVGAMLIARDKLEVIIDDIESRVNELERSGAQVPRKLNEALEVKTTELNEIEEELDQLQTAGILSAEDRYAAYFGRGV